MSLTFSIEGGKDLDRALKQLGPKIEKKVTRSAVRAGAQVIRKEAIRRVENSAKDTGELKRSIQVVSRRRGVKAGMGMSVVTRSGKKYGAKGQNAWYASMIEFGTKLRSATPFMRPALDTKKTEAIQAMAKKAAAAIAKLQFAKVKR